jgi:hypothetical protein
MGNAVDGLEERESGREPRAGRVYSAAYKILYVVSTPFAVMGLRVFGALGVEGRVVP